MIRRPPRSTLFPTRRSSDLPDRQILHRPRHEIGVAPAANLQARPRAMDMRFVEWRGRLVVSRGWGALAQADRKSTRLNSSHTVISYAVFCLKKKKKRTMQYR